VTVEGDQVRVVVTVPVDPATAFTVFTAEIDQWWRRGRKYRVAGREPGVMVLEPRAGGRVFEQYADGTPLHEAGKITTWDPPHHLALEWRVANFAPGEVTYVDVAFSPIRAGATRVELVHRGFAALRPDHPVRHGKPVVEFLRTQAMWWGDVLSAYRDRATQ
jgi:uncharacterized protein YndB with AHSA1/START domain